MKITADKKFMKNILNLLVLNFVLGFTAIHAQQDPGFTQYTYNMSLINPAYATGTPEIVNFGAFHRSQWVGSVGGPLTNTFFAHFPVNEKIETGLSFVNDDIGDGALRENNIYADFAYTINLSEKHKLSFGVKAGATFLNTNFSDFQLESGSANTDPAFSENLNRVFPNFGSGMYFYTNDYYIGLSTPNFLNSKHLNAIDGVQRIGKESTHVYFTGGYVFDVNKDFKLKPSFLIRSVEGVPPMFDISANVLFRDRFEVGVSYRYDDSVSGLAKFGVTPNIHIGYAYDYTTTNLGNFNSGSHEIFILYNLNLIKGYDKSPRFF